MRQQHGLLGQLRRRIAAVGHTSGRRPRRDSAPAVEGLEGRRLLAGKAVVTAQEVAIAGSVGPQFELLVFGTPRNDSIVVLDNGTEDPGNIIVRGGSLNLTSQHPIRDVVVVTGGGKDAVDYVLQGNLIASRPRSVTITSAAANVALPSGLATPAPKGSGPLTVNADIGGIIDSKGTLLFTVRPDRSAPTTLDAGLSGSVLGTAIFNFAPTGPRVGPMTLNFNSSSAIATRGVLVVFAAGGKGKNNLSATYAGRDDGLLGVGLLGGGDRDVAVVRADLAAGSTGRVSPQGTFLVSLTGKRPTVTAIIRRGADSTSTTGISAAIATTSKKSVATRTANVVDQTAGKTTVVTG